MRIIYDILSREFSFDAATSGPYGGVIYAGMARHGINVIFRDLEFGVQIRRNGVLDLDLSFPPAGVVYKSSDQDAILAVRAGWLPDDVLDFSVWMVNAGQRVEGAYQFTAPRPVPPFASWTWGAGGWVPPVAYPSDGAAYEWSEPAGAWVAV